MTDIRFIHHNDGRVLTIEIGDTPYTPEQVRAALVAVISEHSFNLSKDRHERIDILIYRRFHPDLPLYTVIPKPEIGRAGNTTLHRRRR